MINSNTGSAFYLGDYDNNLELFNVTTKLNTIESGGAYHWAAAGNNGPDPETDTGRFLTVAWVSNKPSVLSLIREISYDRQAQQLVSMPVKEYALLHNATFVDGQQIALKAKSVSRLAIPASAGGAVDITASFDVDGAASGFGIATRAPADGA